MFNKKLKKSAYGVVQCARMLLWNWFFCKYYMKLGQQVQISTVYSKVWHVRHAFKTISGAHFSINLQMQFCAPFVAACIGRTVQCAFHTWILNEIGHGFFTYKTMHCWVYRPESSFNVYTFILYFMRCIFN